jgi:hypothetical protein
VVRVVGRSRGEAWKEGSWSGVRKGDRPSMRRGRWMGRGLEKGGQRWGGLSASSGEKTQPRGGQVPSGTGKIVMSMLSSMPLKVARFPWTLCDPPGRGPVGGTPNRLRKQTCRCRNVYRITNKISLLCDVFRDQQHACSTDKAPTRPRCFICARTLVLISVRMKHSLSRSTTSCTAGTSRQQPLQHMLGGRRAPPNQAAHASCW